MAISKIEFSSSSIFVIKSDWELKSSQCNRDLAIKKIAFSFIALLNAGALAGVFAFIILYCPLPTEALIVSPFIGGALTALYILKIPTFGIKSSTYKNYSNPTSLAGHFLTLSFFAPLVLMKKKIDWTNYADPFVAKRICEEIIAEDTDFRVFSETFGPHIGNLKKYGFVTAETADLLTENYREYLPNKLKADFALKEYGAVLLQKNDDLIPEEVRNSMDLAEEAWKEIKKLIEKELPSLDPDLPEVIKTKTKIHLWLRTHFLV